MNKYGLSHGAYPVAEYCEDMSITLPIYPFMTHEEQDIIISIVNKI